MKLRIAIVGGGPLMNLGSHSVDKIQWLSGGLKEDVEPECSMTYSRSIVAVTNTLYRSDELRRELAVVRPLFV